MSDPDDPDYVDATPFATERNLDALAEGLRAALPDWQVQAYRPSENPPHITVYDVNGNVIEALDVDPPITVWELGEPGPTMTVRIEHSPEDGPTWTELT